MRNGSKIRSAPEINAKCATMNMHAHIVKVQNLEICMFRCLTNMYPCSLGLTLKVHMVIGATAKSTR